MYLPSSSLASFNNTSFLGADLLSLSLFPVGPPAAVAASFTVYPQRRLAVHRLLLKFSSSSGSLILGASRRICLIRGDSHFALTYSSNEMDPFLCFSNPFVLIERAGFDGLPVWRENH